MGVGSFGGIGAAGYGAFRPIKRRNYGLKMQHNTMGLSSEKEEEHKPRPGYQSQESINDWRFVWAFVIFCVIATGLLGALACA